MFNKLQKHCWDEDLLHLLQPHQGNPPRTKTEGGEKPKRKRDSKRNRKKKPKEPKPTEIKTENNHESAIFHFISKTPEELQEEERKRREQENLERAKRMANSVQTRRSPFKITQELPKLPDNSILPPP